MQRADGIRGEDNFGGVFAFDNSAVHLTVFHFDGDRFIAADKAGGGEDDGFKQIATIANAADAGEVRSKLSAAVAELVAGVAGRTAAHKDFMAAANITLRKRGQQLFQLSRLFLGAGIEQRRRGNGQ